MAILENIEPKVVFHYFEEISKIPRGSYHEEKISAYLVEFAKAHNLEWYQDKLYNVIMIKEASAGYEDVTPLILQGHMDMVCETTPDCEKDMDTEGLDIYIDGDFVKAKGTTLGGDDGVAIAFALALLSDETLKHPRLEFVCTVCEEVGMDGATGLDVSPLKGKTLLNIDSEEEGEVLSACAGGGTATISLPVKRERIKQSGEVVTIRIYDLTGGHSGMEIHKGRANATFLMNRLLIQLQESVRFRIIDITGGGKDNAIPRETTAKLFLPYKKEYEILENRVAGFLRDVTYEYAVSDPNLKITVARGGVKDGETELTRKSTDEVLQFLSSLPNGVIRMSDRTPGMTETSLNLGIARMEKNRLIVSSAVRSSVGSAYRALIKRLSYLSKFAGAEMKVSGEYPAWEFRETSPLRGKMQKIYREMFDKELKIVSVHAGVECGILAGKIDDLDAVSMGPDILDIHTPDERLSISSTKRMYEFVRNIIEAK